MRDTLALLHHLKNGFFEAQAKTQHFSMLPVSLVINIFSFVVVETSVDLYATFRFEPLHAHSFGISRKLNELFLKY